MTTDLVSVVIPVFDDKIIENFSVVLASFSAITSGIKKKMQAKELLIYLKFRVLLLCAPALP